MAREKLTDMTPRDGTTIAGAETAGYEASAADLGLDEMKTVSKVEPRGIACALAVAVKASRARWTAIGSAGLDPGR